MVENTDNEHLFKGESFFIYFLIFLKKEEVPLSPLITNRDFLRPGR